MAGGAPGGMRAAAISRRGRLRYDPWLPTS